MPVEVDVQAAVDGEVVASGYQADGGFAFVIVCVILQVGKAVCAEGTGFQAKFPVGSSTSCKLI